MADREKRDLSFFFPDKVGKREQSFTLEVSNRFKDDEGKAVKFEFEFPSHEKFKEIKKAASRQVRKGNKMSFEYDQYGMYIKAITECNIYPNFKTAELQDMYKTTSPKELIEKMLYPDEIEKLGQDLSIKIGLVDDPIDLVDDAKN